MQRYAITDRSLLPRHREGWETALCAQVQRWVGAGVEWVQLREKDQPEEVLAPLIRRLAGLIEGSRTRLVINNFPPGFAIDLGAGGVHLPGGASAPQIRAARGVAGTVSVSCHTLPEVAAAREGQAAAILWSPVFGKAVKGVEVRSGEGLAGLADACRAAEPVPVFALGGVTAGNAASCVDAGAVGVAGIRLFHGDHWRFLRGSV